MKQMSPKKKLSTQIWKLALQAFSSCMLADLLGGQMSMVPWKGDTVMVLGQSANSKVLLRAPSK